MNEKLKLVLVILFLAVFAIAVYDSYVHPGPAHNLNQAATPAMSGPWP